MDIKRISNDVVKMELPKKFNAMNILKITYGGKLDLLLQFKNYKESQLFWQGIEYFMELTEYLIF